MSIETDEAMFAEHLDANTDIAKHQKKWLLNNYENYNSRFSRSLDIEEYRIVMVNDGEFRDLVMLNIDSDVLIDAVIEVVGSDSYAVSNLVRKEVESVMLTNLKEVRDIRVDFDEANN